MSPSPELGRFVAVRNAAATVDRAFGLEQPHVALLEFFEYSMSNESEMLFVVAGIASGFGAFPEGHSVRLPAGMMEDYSDLENMPVWTAEVRFNSFGAGPDRVTHIALERMVAISSIVFVEYANVMRNSWDPWPRIAQMQARCTRDAQTRLIPREIREHLGIPHPD